jgi:hypothetical protein
VVVDGKAYDVTSSGLGPSGGGGEGAPVDQKTSGGAGGRSSADVSPTKAARAADVGRASGTVGRTVVASKTAATPHGHVLLLAAFWVLGVPIAPVLPGCNTQQRRSVAQYTAIST